MCGNPNGRGESSMSEKKKGKMRQVDNTAVNHHGGGESSTSERKKSKMRQADASANEEGSQSVSCQWRPLEVLCLPCVH